MDEFNLSEMTDAYKEEFAAASEWFRLSFHSYQEFPDYPYVNSSYEDIYKLFNMIKNEIFRFVGEKTGLKFKKPDDNLDPNLFTNEELKAELQRRSGDELYALATMSNISLRIILHIRVNMKKKFIQWQRLCTSPDVSVFLLKN